MRDAPWLVRGGVLVLKELSTGQRPNCSRTGDRIPAAARAPMHSEDGAARPRVFRSGYFGLRSASYFDLAGFLAALSAFSPEAPAFLSALGALADAAAVADFAEPLALVSFVSGSFDAGAASSGMSSSSDIGAASPGRWPSLTMRV